MNIIKKIKNLIYYINSIKKIESELYSKFNVKVDNVYRLYTVYSINPKEYEQYGGSDKIIVNNEIESAIERLSASKMNNTIMNGEDLFKKKVDTNLSKLERFLNDNGLIELYGLTQKRRIDTYNYKVVIEYKYLRTNVWANVLLVTFLTIIGSSIIGIILGLFKMFL